MKKITHNKLVRDKIPNLLIGKGLSFKAHKLNNVEFEIELANKLVEESREVAGKVFWLNHLCNQEPVSNEELDSHLSDVTEELADVLEVYMNLVKSLKIKTSDIEKAADLKRASNGGFEDRIFLEWVETKKELKK